MDDDTSKQADEDPGAPAKSERSARDELVDGLSLVLRAARRAAGQLDPAKLEAFSQKARDHLSSIDRQKIEAVGRRAASQAKNLDPSSIERYAEEAGKELVHVVERLATRVEKFVDDVQARVDDEDGPTEERPRIRVKRDDE
jgi:hypothetical protein